MQCRSKLHEHGTRQDHIENDDRSRSDYNRHRDHKQTDDKLEGGRQRRVEQFNHEKQRDKPSRERQPKDVDRLREEDERMKDRGREYHRSGRLEEKGEASQSGRRDRVGKDDGERSRSTGGSDDSRQMRKGRREREKEEDVSQYE